MCGICGLHGGAFDPAGRRRVVERMTGAMIHRGPDDVGAYHDDEVGLGFRRLAVIDLETGQQPIRLEDDRAVIVLNGEIYNFRELRGELEPRHTFRSRGDVEVVLRLYAELGIRCLERLNGMFALAIWDRRRRTLHLARDRFGIKPLYLSRPRGGLAFASEVAALLAGGFPESRSVDLVQLRHYLWQKYVAPTASILDGVEALEPGTVLSIGPGGERVTRYWEPPEPVQAASEGASAAELDRVLHEAVRRQLVADVPLGVFLSGGLDSATLTALTRAAGAQPLRTFSVGFTGPGSVSELPRAARIAQRFETEHHELTMDAAEVARDVDRIVGALDGPLGDATAIPTWYMSRFARERVTVALSGEGADELFGGYPRQRYDVWLDRLWMVPRPLLALGLRIGGRAPSARMMRRLRMPPGPARQLDWSRVFTADAIDGLARQPLPDESRLLALHDGLALRWDELRRRDPLNARLLVDRELFLPGDLLPKVDRMSMAHSLEVRVPYLDNAVADHVLALPGRLKVRGNESKRLLRRVAAGLLPPDALTGRKQGFDVPIGAWLRGPLRPALTDWLSESAVRRRGWFRPDRVTGLVREHLAETADHGEPLWLLMALEGWQQQRLDGASRTAG